MTRFRTSNGAAAAPFLEPPPTPSWYPVAAGAWSAAFVLAVGGLRDRFGLFTAAMGVLVGLLVAYTTWFGRRWGGWPPARRAPAEIDRVMRRFLLGGAVIIGAIMLIGHWTGYILAAGATFIAVTMWVGWYDTAYTAAVVRAKEHP